jgi:hypothetical protein
MELTDVGPAFERTKRVKYGNLGCRDRVEFENVEQRVVGQWSMDGRR